MRRPGPRHLIAALAVVGSALVLRGASPRTGALALVPGSESAEVARRLRSEFDSPLREVAVLHIGPLPAPAATDSGRALVRRIVQPLGTLAGVTAVVSPATSLDTLLHSTDGTSAIALVGLRDAAALAAGRQRVAAAATALARDGVPVQVEWTGEMLLLDALHATMLRQMHEAEWLAAPLVLAAAWWSFGSLLPAALALLAAVAAVVVGLGALHLLAPLVPVGPVADAMVVMVGTALTLDYLLWRRRGGMPATAIRRAALCAAIAFAVLLLAPTPELHGAAMGGLLGVGVATCAALLARADAPALKAPSGAARLVHLATERPLAASALAATGALVLAAAAYRVPPPTRPDHWLPPTAEPTVVLRKLEAIGRGAAAAPVTVLLPMPAGVSVYDAEGWGAVAGAMSRLAAIPDVVDVRSIATIGTRERTIARDVLPDAVRAAWVSRDERTAIVQVLPGPALRRVDSLIVAARAAAGPGALVGGLAAVGHDHLAAMRAALLPLVGLMVLGTTLALLVTFRAPLLALKAVAMDLLVAAAALGVVALAFPGVQQHGFPVTVPLLALGAAFALSIDYELLLLFAVRDARRRGMDERAAVVDGTLQATPMMLRGAAMLVVVFGAFATRSFAPLAMTGTVLLATVVLDITLVRLLLAPALLSAWGRWNWWPGAEAGANPPPDVR